MIQGYTDALLQSGVIYHRDTGTPYDYRMLCLDYSFLPRMMQLQDIIIAHLSHPHLLQPLPEDYMGRHLGEKGFVLGVIVGDELIAFRNTYFPDRGEPESNLGPDLGLPSRFFDSLVNLQFSCVLPAFRGNGLGYIMMQHALQLIKAMGQYSFCCATVSPLNLWSIDILLRNKLFIRGLKSKYGGKPRYLLCQNLHDSRDMDMSDAVKVGLTDFNRQYELFAQGFCGVALEKIAGIGPLPLEEMAEEYQVIFIHHPLH